jgi:hypothetical protein
MEILKLISLQYRYITAATIESGLIPPKPQTSLN